MGGSATKSCWGCAPATAKDNEEQLNVDNPSGDAADEIDLSLTVARLIVKFQDDSGSLKDLVVAKRPFGIRLTKDGKDYPVVVKSVTPNSHAEEMGVKPGWKVVEVAAQEVSKMGEEELYRQIHGKPGNYSLSMQNVLDVMDDFRSQIPLISCYFEQHASKQAKANALAKAAAASMNKPDEADKLVPVVLANLALVEPLSPNLVRATKRYLELIETWRFETTGNPNNPPTLSDENDEKISITQEEMVRIHILAYIHFPEKFHTLTTMLGLTGSLIRGLPQETEKSPCAVITVGPPGSGKTFCLSSSEGCLNYIQNKHSGPARDS